MKTCPNCNVTVTSEQRRCGNCGQVLTPTHVSMRKTQPIHAPPPTYIPPPSPHPSSRPSFLPTEVRLVLRPRVILVGVLVVAILVYVIYLLTRPAQLAGQWYGTLSGNPGAAGSAYAEVYLDLHVGGNGAVTGTGEFCALAGNPSVSPGHRSSITITGQANGTQG